HFDERDLHREQRVAQRDAGMRQRGGIDDDELDAFGLGLLDPLDQGAFVVALERVELVPELAGVLAEIALDLPERLGSVEVRLAAAEQVEVGAVQQQDQAHGRIQPAEKERAVCQSGAKNAKLWLDRPKMPPRSVPIASDRDYGARYLASNPSSFAWERPPAKRSSTLPSAEIRTEYGRTPPSSPSASIALVTSSSLP